MTKNLFKGILSILNVRNTIWLITNKYSLLGISIVISIGTLIFLILSDHDWNIFKRKFSERLVVYLAVVDILFR